MDDDTMMDKRRRLASVIGLGLFIAAIGILWFGRYVTERSPLYSLDKLARAIRAHDIGGCYRYIDIDAVADSLSAHMPNGNLASVKKNTRDALELIMKEQPEDLPGAPRKRSETARKIIAATGLDLKAFAEKGRKDVGIVRHGSVAAVTIPAANGIDCMFGMRQAPEGYWRVVRLMVPTPEELAAMRKRSCARSIRAVRAAIRQWAIDGKRDGDAIVDVGQIIAYLPSAPVCPSGGKYVYRTVNDDPQCTIHNKDEIGKDTDLLAAERSACRENATQLMRAVEEWAIRGSKNDDDEVSLAEVMSARASPLPACPSGGDYACETVKDIPLCSAHGVFPELQAAKEELKKERIETRNAERYASELAECVGLYRSGDEKEAVRRYEDVARQDRTLPAAAYRYFGERFEEDGKYREAAAAYEKALAISSGDHALSYSMYRVYKALGNTEEAARSLARAFDLKYSETVCEELAALYAEQGRNEDAVTILRECVRKSPKRAGLYQRLARSLAALQRYDDALAVIDEALVVFTGSDAAPFNDLAGDCYYAKKDFRQAANRYQDALRWHSRNAEYNFKLGRAQAENHDFAGAITHFVAAIDGGKNDAELQTWLGRAYEGNREPGKAKEAFFAAKRLESLAQ